MGGEEGGEGWDVVVGGGEGGDGGSVYREGGGLGRLDGVVERRGYARFG